MEFELHSGRDYDNGRDLASMGGSDLEACRQWCAGNNQCGGFVQFIGSTPLVRIESTPALTQVDGRQIPS